MSNELIKCVFLLKMLRGDSQRQSLELKMWG